MTKKNPRNLDPITDEPGTHPVGVGAGTLAGGSAGAAAGAAAGPIGAIAGAVAGGVAGAVAGKAIAEEMNPTMESELAYWEQNYSSRPYVRENDSFETFRSAFRSGIEGYNSFGSKGRSFDEAEEDMRDDYESSSSLSWNRVKSAARDAWDRIENQFSSRNQH